MADDGTEKRIVRESGVEARIAGIVEPILDELGFRLVRIKLSSLNGQTLQIMAERPDGTMGVDDCEAVSHAISPVLDIEDPIAGAYHLEISSPGVDRPLVRPGDFTRWAGHGAKIEMRRLIDGRKRFKGTIIEVDGDHVVIERVDSGPADEGRKRIPLDEIADARLIMSDALIREALKRDKALRKANRDMTMPAENGSQ